MSDNTLDVEQLAAYLHVGPQQVTKLAERGEIPGRKVGGSWRFAEAEVHAWLEQRIGASDNEALQKMQRVVDKWSDSHSGAVRLVDLLPMEAIELPLAARTPKAVIRRMCELAQGTGLLWDAAKMAEAVEAREELHPTALDSGVALLHPRRPQSSILGGPLLALGVLTSGLPFGNRGGHSTDVFFLICSTDDRVHLQVLAKLSRLLAGTSFLDELRHMSSAAEVSELLQRCEAEIDGVDYESLAKCP
ncbi:MAG: PTS sugar transporter subunit IIA [Pirellulales bacterium]